MPRSNKGENSVSLIVCALWAAMDEGKEEDAKAKQFHWHWIWTS